MTRNLSQPVCKLCRGQKVENQTREAQIVYAEEANSIEIFGDICIHILPSVKSFLNKFGAAYKNKRFRKRSGINELTITINSPGGFALQGLALHDLIKYSPFPINTVALGGVASAALLPYLAGRRRYVYKNAIFLAHRSSKLPDESEGYRHSEWFYQQNQELKLLDKLSNQIILANSNLREKELRALQEREKHITAEEAISYGLAHEIIKNH